MILIIINLDFNKIKETILSINPIFIVIAMAITIPRLLIRNYAWQLIQKEQKIKIGYWKSLKIFLIGYFYCTITPGYVGHLMRVPYLKKETNQAYGKLFVNTFLEVILRSISLYSMITIGLIFVVGLSTELYELSILWTVFIILNIAIFFFFIKKERGDKLFRTLIKYFIPRKVKKDFLSFVKTFYDDFPRTKKLILPLFIGAITWIMVFSQEYIVVIALGLNIPYLHFLLLFPIANIIGFIPVTFAGLGTREAAAIFIFTSLFVVSKEEILVVSLLGFLITEISPGIVGFILSLTESIDKEKKIT